MGTPENPVIPGKPCTPGLPATSQIPRLTNAQYDRTVRDLLGVTTLAASNNALPSSILATDQAGGLTELGWTGYKAVAEMIAAQVMKDPTLKGNFLKCTPTGDGSACLHETIVSFGRRAFRRPLAADEVARFDAIIAQGKEVTPTGAFEEVAEFLLYLFLVSPSFIQRAEITETADSAGNYVLSGHEIAQRLSFMLWGTTPDDTLNAAADQGQLSTQQQIFTQATRMLQDPRARQMVSGFHRSYLHLGVNTRWDTAQKDAKKFPTFNKALVPVMADETERFFDSVTFKGGAFRDFFLSPVAFVNASTAPFYGLDATKFGADLQEVNLDPATRPGFLTRLGFLNAYAGSTRTSPILRGVFITKDVLGINTGEPPPGALETPLPTSAMLDTNRKQVDQQTSGANCVGCHHTFINPPGFVMEAYNAIGMLQTTEANTGAPIDTAANVMIDGDAGEPVKNAAELMAKLAASRNAQYQYAQKWVGYAYEREGHPLDSCVVDGLTHKLTQGGYTVLNLITDLTQSDSFRIRAVEVTQ